MATTTCSTCASFLAASRVTLCLPSGATTAFSLPSEGKAKFCLEVMSPSAVLAPPLGFIARF